MAEIVEPRKVQQHGEMDSIELSLLGGPLHRLGCRLGLVRRGTNTILLGLALSAFLWVVLSILSFIDGVGVQVFSLSVISAHIRLLIAIPLFFLCETWFDPELTVFVREAVRTDLVPQATLPALHSEIGRITRWKDSWLPETIFLLAATGFSLLAPRVYLTAVTVEHAAGPATGGMILTGEWYWFVCLTLFRFLLLRWIWRLGLWWYFLWCMSRLDLHLVPTHPDYTAGLGYLDVVHVQFVPLIVAISALESGALAEEIFKRQMTLEGAPLEIFLILITAAMLFIGPLCIFAPKLWLCRVKGLKVYMGLAARYVNDFEKKWVSASTEPKEEPLLGTPDLQSLADLSSSVNVVGDMRFVPVSRQTLLAFAVAALAPMLPLLLLQYPIDVLTKSLFETLFGLR